MKRLKQTIRIFTPILLLGMSCLAPLSGQNCFIRLTDASGIDPTPDQSGALENAACRLRDSLPAAFRNAFKVYDFGFYLHNETMVGGYPEMFQAAITQVEALSQYYLLFGKQTDKTGVYTKFWVALKLPTTAQFSCMSALQRAVYPKRIEAKTNEKYEESQKAYSTYHAAEIAGIHELIKIISEIKGCCTANRNRIQERLSGCNGCSDEEAGQFFQFQGFEKIDLNISTAPFANLNNAKVKDYSFHKVTIGGQTGYLGEIMAGQIEEFNQWFSLNLLVTSYTSLCVDSILGYNFDAFRYKEDFNCQINFPSGEGLKPSDIKIIWNKKEGSWIKDAATANLIISLLKCKIYRFLGVSFEDCFSMLSVPPWIANMNDMSGFDFFYAIYLHAQNSEISIVDLIDGYKDFGGPEVAAAPDSEAQNGIDIVSTSVATSVPTTGILIGQSRRSPPNVEDLQSGVDGDCNGIKHDCMTCYRFLSPNVPCRPLDEEDLKEYMISLMTFFSMDPLESIAVSFAERFFSKNSSDYYSTELSEHVRLSPNMRDYMKKFGAALNDELKSNGGVIYLDQEIRMGGVRPIFGGNYNRWHGLTILLNDTETTDIWYVGNFSLDNVTKVWSADFYFEVTDHFGLDKHDAVVYQDYHTGFAAWWALQHRKGYPAFKTKITILATLKGKL